MVKYIRAYKFYYPYIFNIVYKKIKNRNDAEDISQEVFTFFYNSFSKIPEESQKAWLLSTANNILLNYFRKKNKYTIENIDDHEHHKNMQTSNDTRELQMILKEIIEKDETFNDDEEKIIFEMIALFKYPYKEVAQRMGLSKRQIEYKYKQISKRIISCLEEKGVKKEMLYE